MIVCHCRALSERTICDVIQRGAHSPREVALACHAGRTCGGCIPVVRELIAREKSRAPAPLCEISAAAAS
jgi:bacterioferritin-associated ferredoxin